MITQLHGDNLDLLLTLAPDSVQTIVTSPPYFGLRSYSIPPSAWPEIVYVPMAGLPPITIPAMRCQLGAEPEPLAYIGHIVHVFRLARPALRDDGTLWVNLGDSYVRTGGEPGGGNRELMHLEGKQSRMTKGLDYFGDKNLLGIPHRAALALQADGWVWRSEVIWHAPNKMPESVRDRPTRAHEQILLFGKGPRYYYDSEAVAEQAQDTRSIGRRTAISGQGNGELSSGERFGGGAMRNRRTVWSIPTSPMPSNLRGASDAHYAAWPPALVEIMIKASTANKACAACGAAWVRQVERDAGVVNVDEGLRQQNGGTQKVTLGVTDQVVRRDLGFAPACDCDAGIGRCVVLDPFGGTGTTGQVAEQLGRDSILIDLGYQELQQKRTDNLQMTIEAYL